MLFRRLCHGKIQSVSLMFIVASVLFLMSIYRGIQFPMYWGATHYFLSYDLGFIKRGLIGSMISALNSPLLYGYSFFLLCSVTIFLLNCLLLFSLVRELIKTNNRLVTYCTVIYCSSYAIVVFAFCIGFFDHILLLFTLCIIKIRHATLRYWVFFALSPVILFIHEAAFLLFFPVILLTFWLDYLKTPAKKTIILLLVAGLMNALIVFFPEYDDPA